MADISTTLDNIIAHWTLDETTGDRLDSTPNGHDLTDNNTIDNETGALNSAANFNGTSHYLSRAHASLGGDFDNLTALSVSCWINPDNVGISQYLVSQYNTSDNTRCWGLRLDNDEITFLATDDGLANTGHWIYATTDAANLSTGSWIHVVSTLDVATEEIKIYINGSLVSSTKSGTMGTSIYNGAILTLGARGNPASYYNGGLDEVTITNDVITAGEVTTLYNSGTPLAYSGGAATAPSAFVVGNWTLSDLGTDGDIRIAITTLPSNGGSAITDLEYQQDAGSWTSLGATTTGNYDISGLTNGTEYDFKIRAVNSVGNGADSDTKSATPTAVPSAFTSGQWSVNDLGTGGDIRITISTLPAANGTAITDLEYKIDAGSWTSLSGTTTGNYDISGLTDDVEVDVLVRAVNATGNGADSDTKAVTPTTASGTPTVTTQAVSDITQTTATGNGNVTAEGGDTVTERGVCWSTSETPTTGDSTATASGTTGAYTANITGLDPETTYYVRAYAVNTNGTSYGSQVSFTTLAIPIYQRKRYNGATGVYELIG
jgi:hypothetical protein